MHRGLFTCASDTTLMEVARTMARRAIHCVVVAGSGGAPWGVISDLDLVAAATVRDLDDQTAGGSASTPLITVAPNETLERAAQLMIEHATSHLIVIGPDGLPIGVISTLDVAATLATEAPS